MITCSVCDDVLQYPIPGEGDPPFCGMCGEAYRRGRATATEAAEAARDKALEEAITLFDEHADEMSDPDGAYWIENGKRVHYVDALRKLRAAKEGR